MDVCLWFCVCFDHISMSTIMHSTFDDIGRHTTSRSTTTVVVVDEGVLQNSAFGHICAFACYSIRTYCKGDFYMIVHM